jgi:hypothetical protein
MLNQLRLARCWRRRVSMHYPWCDQSHRKYDLRENFHADSPCLNQRLTHPNLLQCVVRGALNLGLYSPEAGPGLSFEVLAILSVERLCRREGVSNVCALNPAVVPPDSRIRWSGMSGGNGVVGGGSRHYQSENILINQCIMYELVAGGGFDFCLLEISDPRVPSPRAGR